MTSMNSNCWMCGPTNTTSMVEEDEDEYDWISTVQDLCDKCQQLKKRLERSSTIKIEQTFKFIKNNTKKIKFNNYLTVKFPLSRGQI